MEPLTLLHEIMHSPLTETPSEQAIREVELMDVRSDSRDQLLEKYLSMKYLNSSLEEQLDRHHRFRALSQGQSLAVGIQRAIAPGAPPSLQTGVIGDENGETMRTRTGRVGLTRVRSVSLHGQWAGAKESALGRASFSGPTSFRHLPTEGEEDIISSAPASPIGVGAAAFEVGSFPSPQALRGFDAATHSSRFQGTNRTHSYLPGAASQYEGAEIPRQSFPGGYWLAAADWAREERRRSSSVSPIQDSPTLKELQRKFNLQSLKLFTLQQSHENEKRWFLEENHRLCGENFILRQSLAVHKEKLVRLKCDKERWTQAAECSSENLFNQLISKRSSLSTMASRSHPSVCSAKQ
jgi:hypothetical protein